jgi:hypothetical protein
VRSDSGTLTEKCSELTQAKARAEAASAAASDNPRARTMVAVFIQIISIVVAVDSRTDLHRQLTEANQNENSKKKRMLVWFRIRFSDNARITLMNMNGLNLEQAYHVDLF